MGLHLQRKLSPEAHFKRCHGRVHHSIFWQIPFTQEKGPMAKKIASPFFARQLSLGLRQIPSIQIKACISCWTIERSTVESSPRSTLKCPGKSSQVLAVVLRGVWQLVAIILEENRIWNITRCRSLRISFVSIYNLLYAKPWCHFTMYSSLAPTLYTVYADEHRRHKTTLLSKFTRGYWGKMSLNDQKDQFVYFSYHKLTSK